MKGAVAWFAENHVAANLLMMFLLLAGVVTALTMKIEVFPETSLDRIQITTIYRGASPSEVEEGVVRLIEEKVAGLAGIEQIDSTAREGFGAVTIEVMNDWDLQQLLDEVKAEVDRITTLPEEAEEPVVREVTRRTQVVSLAVYGNAGEGTLKHLAERIKDDVTNLEGITLAEISGMREPEIHVEVSEETLRRYGLTLGAVAQAVRRGSLDLPAGSVKTDAGEILIRTKGRRYYAADYRDIPVITQPDGTVVTLGRIARLRDGFEDMDIRARFQGKPAAIIQVYRVADQNALHVAATVKQYVEELRGTLPAGVSVSLYQDRSEILKSRLNLLLKNMAMGLVLVSILLGIFLDLRLAFWVTLGIPISFAAGLWVLPHLDVSINMISLFAFIMVLGIVVDDAIIVGENIFSKQEEGYGSLPAAVEGAVEVGHPVVFAVFTTVVAFFPLLLGSGMMGNVMRNIPLVIIVVLMGSLIESLFILPAHLERSRSRRLAGGGTARKEKAASRALKWFIRKCYAPAVALCVRWRYAVVGVGIASLLLTAGVWKAGWIKFTFFPKLESDTLIASLTMPVGTPLERTLEVVARMERAARDALAEADAGRPPGAQPLLEYSAAQVGRHLAGGGPHGGSADTGGHLAQVYVQVLEGEKRSMRASELTRMWRGKLGPVPEAESITFESALFRAGNPVEIHLSLGDHEKLLESADELKEELKRYPGVFDVADSFLPGKNEMQLTLKPAARSLGITLDDLASQVRHAFYGAEALRFQRDQNEVKVLVRYPDAERRSLGTVEDMRIRTPEGAEVPFELVAEQRMERGYATIERSQRRRVIKVSADVDESKTNANEVRQDLMTRVIPELTARHPGLRTSMEGEGKEQQESLADVFSGLAIALFGIYALLAVPFRSFSQPLVVMAAIPFGVVGAVLGHLIMGLNLTLLSLFGIVGLAGVVVNDSLVLIHATNRLREKGMGAEEAIVLGGRMRFRAILLTSLTTFAGLTPMILEKSLQARFLIPMAVSLGFGVLFATGITLLLIPSGYVILEDVKRVFGVRSRTLQAEDADYA